jgi:transcriptional regulator with XRE-family HTH domain
MILKGPIMSGKYDFGVIRTLRRRMNLTLEKLAKILRLTYPTVESIEKNKTSPSLNTLDALASALEISASDLVGLAENHTVLTRQTESVHAETLRSSGLGLESINAESPLRLYNPYFAGLFKVRRCDPPINWETKYSVQFSASGCIPS